MRGSNQLSSPSEPLSVAKPWQHLDRDVPAGIVVFLVALPLCLGIALASGAPALSGLVAGMLGGLVVPLISQSPTSVSGPAAGLAAIVLAGIHQVGHFDAFLVALVLAGVLQIALGALRAGVVAFFVPSPVIKGLLAAIGLLLIKKQLPVALGGSLQLNASSFGPLWITGVALAALVAFDVLPPLKKLYFVPGALVAIVLGTALNEVWVASSSDLALSAAQLVALPPIAGLNDLVAALPTPRWEAIQRPEVWRLAATLAAVASLETLLNLSATDRLDPQAFVSPPHRELVAQGVANTVSGLLGGLPITSVIVRSSTNVNAGARTKLSAMVHGLCLFVAVVYGGPWLSRVPLASLAGILLMTGYKLAKPSIVRELYRAGLNQFVPFVTTVIAIVALDLLQGVMIGLLVGVAFVLRESMTHAFTIQETETSWRIVLEKDTFFFARAALQRLLDAVPNRADIVIDATAARFIDPDVIEMLLEFREAALARGKTVEVIGLTFAPQPAGAAH